MHRNILLILIGGICYIQSAFSYATPSYTPLSCTLSSVINTTVSYIYPGTKIMRDIEIAIQIPVGQPYPLPGIIWSHGGAGGGTPQNMQPWGTASAEACYFSVSIGHSWPDSALETHLCGPNELNLIQGVDCGPDLYKLLNLIRPHDIAAVIDYLEINYSSEFDADNFAIGGHSAGAGGALMVAGAERGYLTGSGYDLRTMEDPRPKAFLAFSPQGPGEDGFYETFFASPSTSWDNITRPVLMATGDGDNGCDGNDSSYYDCNHGPGPSNRRAVYNLMPKDPTGAISKYRLYVESTDSWHTVFSLKRNKCASEGGPVSDTQCDLIIDTITKAGIAFLDWHLRGDSTAETFLLHRQINIPGANGIFKWSYK